ncbi:hypothetical protein LX32DRAFT_256825 [Colletotrichum zoysiae]|uniref:Uncharacterized protein n=1 Tax=Colletotrichum zoysiae TaxID=1216348 RepID=A0AAD9HM77_9PEZI|nr:hypothetical protein LX32DRAFT_256825 [Colletotrichum zoysiae]
MVERIGKGCLMTQPGAALGPGLPRPRPAPLLCVRGGEASWPWRLPIQLVPPSCLSTAGRRIRDGRARGTLQPQPRRMGTEAPRDSAVLYWPAEAPDHVRLYLCCRHNEHLHALLRTARLVIPNICSSELSHLAEMVCQNDARFIRLPDDTYKSTGGNLNGHVPSLDALRDGGPSSMLRIKAIHQGFSAPCVKSSPRVVPCPSPPPSGPGPVVNLAMTPRCQSTGFLGAVSK